jgi:hypothetical protein
MTKRLDELFFFKQSSGSIIDRYIPAIRINEQNRSRIFVEVISATIFNTIPNISVALNNNTLTFTYLAVPYTITFPDGIYSVTDLNGYIKKWLYNNNIPPVNGVYLFSISGDVSTQRCVIQANVVDLTINFNTSKIRNVLGFVTTNSITSTIVGQSFFGDTVAQFNSINEIVMHSNLVSGMYDDNQLTGLSNRSDVLAVIQIDQSTGSQIIYRPLNPIRANLIVDNINNIRIYLTSETGGILEINDPWSVLLHIYETA